MPRLGAAYVYLLGIYLGDGMLTAAPRRVFRLRIVIAGLIHSDGCRAINRVRRPTLDGVKEYQYPRYFFSNASPEIRAMFVAACAQIGIACRRTTERNLSIARRDDVALLDTFIGPKG